MRVSFFSPNWTNFSQKNIKTNAFGLFTIRKKQWVLFFVKERLLCLNIL